MKTKTLLLAVILGTTTISCSGEKSENSNEHPTEVSTKTMLANTINGTWKIISVEGDGGISKDVKFVFSDNTLTLDAGYYKDKVKMVRGNENSFSYTDQNNITWDFNYSISGNTLTLENLYNNNVHATYTLEKE